MKVLEILEKLQSEVENAPSMPLISNKIIIEKDELLDLIDELRSSLPEEVKEARKVLDDEERIRVAAKRKADGLLEEARAQKQQLIETSAITKNAYEEADAIIKQAKAEAGKLRVRSIEYITNLLGKAQDDLREVIATIDDNKAELKDKKKAVTNSKTQE